MEQAEKIRWKDSRAQTVAEADTSDGRPPLPHMPRRFWKWRPAIAIGGDNSFVGTGVGSWIVRFRTSFWRGSSRNVIMVGRNFRTSNLTIRVTGTGNRVEIGDDVRFNGRIEVHGSGLTLRIGDRCDFKTSEILVRSADISIGRDCLVGSGVHLRSSDMHVITDRASRAQVNPPQPIAVGDGVWLCRDAAILKGARVPDGCIVGYRSTVTRSFDEVDCVLAGSPARVVRRGVSWSR